MIYFWDMMVVIAGFTGTGYVVVKTVDAGVSMTRGFYATFANDSAFANNLLAYEVSVIISLILWALIVTIVTLNAASSIWNELDERFAEAAASSKGLETPVNWVISIKTTFLMMIYILGVLISAYSLGEITNEVVTWFGEYDNDTNSEGTDKTNGNADPDGTSA